VRTGRIYGQEHERISKMFDPNRGTLGRHRDNADLTRFKEENDVDF